MGGVNPPAAGSGTGLRRAGQAAGLEADDLVHLVKPGPAVGDEQDRAAFSGGQQVPGQLVGGLLIKVLGRLVEDEDGKVGQQHPRQGEPLALTAGQPHAVLAYLCVQAGGQALDPFQQPGPTQRRADLLVGGLAAGQPQVLAEGGVEDVRVLGAQPDDRPDACRRQAR